MSAWLYPSCSNIRAVWEWVLEPVIAAAKVKVLSANPN